MRLSTGRFGMRLVDSIHRFDLVMRFVDSIRSLDRSIALHHVVDTSRLNNSARRNARSDEIRECFEKYQRVPEIASPEWKTYEEIIEKTEPRPRDMY